MISLEHSQDGDVSRVFPFSARARAPAERDITIKTMRRFDGNSEIITSTVTVALLAALLPATSLTIKLTENMPTLEYVCVGATPEPVLPSPKSQR
jgi:hypothetical protein